MKIKLFCDNRDLFCAKDFLGLYIKAGWWGENSKKDLFYIQNIMENSFPFVGVFDNDKIIGMGRAISDKVSDAYIQDIFVLEQYRGKGLGKKLVNNIINFLQNNEISWIGLIAKPGKTIFYENIGFEKMKDFSPMLYEK
ncbi:MAG: GNAT family N-acetyltransferase [Candidatus Muirbacterium halophilum]|nr:GNAT family N-acetyltransferase [Candidatus Muirbacterium halophilum]MCK9474949.1 GNAT family N-acetyltransferase [Candidatus Muirbacterium halophilum]